MSELQIIGGGLFGCTAAIVAKQRGYDKVTLHEKKDKILGGATSHNQFRLHRGYHYPRSDETARQCINAMLSFRSFYDCAVIDENKTTYGIASKGSRTSPEQFIDFMKRFGLGYRTTLIGGRACDLMVEVREPRLDFSVLKAHVWSLLKKHDVDIQLNSEVGVDNPTTPTIVATYDQINRTTGRKDVYRTQVVEKPIVWIDDVHFRDRGIVILDGPFGCVDPFGRSGLHVMSHVRESIWAEAEQVDPVETHMFIGDRINRGAVVPSQSRFKLIWQANRPHMDIPEPIHVASLFTRRIVKAGVGDTDERTTDVNRIGDRCVSILSGKMVTCVDAARRALTMLQMENAHR